jgi:hypothetical protein
MQAEKACLSGDFATGVSILLDLYVETTPSQITSLPTGGAWDIAVYGNDIYWTDATTIMKADIYTGDVTMLASGQESPAAITVDSVSVYWVNRGTEALSNGTVMKVAMTGSSPIVIASGLDDPSSIAVDDMNVYWTNAASNGGSMKAPLDGGPVTSLVSQRFYPTGIAVDVASVYWIDGGPYGTSFGVMKLTPK